MLVLTREVDGTLMIGDDIEVTVVDIRGDKVRLGITAPKEIAVHRKEVYEAIKRETRDAARVKPEDAGRTADVPQHQANEADGTPTEVRDQAHGLRAAARAAQKDQRQAAGNGARAKAVPRDRARAGEGKVRSGSGPYVPGRGVRRS